MGSATDLLDLSPTMMTHIVRRLCKWCVKAIGRHISHQNALVIPTTTWLVGHNGSMPNLRLKIRLFPYAVILAQWLLSRLATTASPRWSDIQQGKRTQ